MRCPVLFVAEFNILGLASILEPFKHWKVHLFFHHIVLLDVHSSKVITWLLSLFLLLWLVVHLLIDFSPFFQIYKFRLRFFGFEVLYFVLLEFGEHLQRGKNLFWQVNPDNDQMVGWIGMGGVFPSFRLVDLGTGFRAWEGSRGSGFGVAILHHFKSFIIHNINSMILIVSLFSYAIIMTDL